MEHSFICTGCGVKYTLEESSATQPERHVLLCKYCLCDNYELCYCCHRYFKRDDRKEDICEQCEKEEHSWEQYHPERPEQLHSDLKTARKYHEDY